VDRRQEVRVARRTNTGVFVSVTVTVTCRTRMSVDRLCANDVTVVVPVANAVPEAV